MSALILDTHALLWFLAGDKRLSRKAKDAIAAPQSERYISVATVWELSIKVSLDRLSLPTSVETYISEKLENGFRLLSLEWQHAAAVSTLEWHHRDPFDRLLIAQSLYENIPIVSGDSEFKKYGVKIIW